MAAPKPKDPLDALQALLNDVLVQTGKALRASRRDGQGNLAPPQGLSQSKLPVTIEAFQKALDDIEGDIMIAKSVILRDLSQIQADQSTGQQQQCSLPFPSSLKQSIPSPSTSIPRLPLNRSPHQTRLAPLPVKDAGNMTNSNAGVKTEDNALSALNATPVFLCCHKIHQPTEDVSAHGSCRNPFRIDLLALEETGR